VLHNAKSFSNVKYMQAICRHNDDQDDNEDVFGFEDREITKGYVLNREILRLCDSFHEA
jgi:hypothetical protein